MGANIRMHSVSRWVGGGGGGWGEGEVRTFFHKKTVTKRVSEVSRKNKKGGVIIPDDNISSR